MPVVVHIYSFMETYSLHIDAITHSVNFFHSFFMFSKNLVKVFPLVLANCQNSSHCLTNSTPFLFHSLSACFLFTLLLKEFLRNCAVVLNTGELCLDLYWDIKEHCELVVWLFTIRPSHVNNRNRLARIF